MPDRLLAIQNALRGRYTVERLLGEGGMASVYLARDERHNRPVAIKLLHPELTRAIGVERFGREIEIAARLSHPHILPLLDSGTVDLGAECPACPYYVMPFIEGESLRDKLVRVRVLPLEEALRIAREVADALEHAHRRGVVHRDIKPENILLSGDHAVVADFGIGRALDQVGADTLTRTGQALGTPQYMSPEQITGEREIDGRADVYSLGSVLYEMLTGIPPGTLSGGSMQSLLARRLAEPPPRVRTANPAVPPAVERALLKALAVERGERFATAGEFAAAITATPSGTFEAAEPRRFGRLGLIAGLAVVVVGGVLALTQLARQGRAQAITSLAIAPEPADSATAYLSEGVHEAVADLLRRLPQLRVTAPSLVAQVARQRPELNALQLGQELKVGAVLTWALRPAGDSVQLRAELFRIPGGDLLWSVRYARPRAEIAALQGRIAGMIADSLRLQLTGVERATMERQPTANAAAYDLYLRGRQFENRAIPLGAREARASLDSALHYAREAIALDSSFAAPYALLSSYYFISGFRGWRSPLAAIMDSAMSYGRRALAIDSTLAEGWVNLISQNIYLNDDWAAAGEAVKGAVRRAGYDPYVLHYAGLYVGEVEGRLDSAIALLRRSVELGAGLQSLNTLGDLLMRARRYDSAVAALRRAIAFDPSVPGPRRRLVQSYEKLGKYREAIEERRALGGSDSAGAVAFARAFQQDGAAGYERERRADLIRQVEAMVAAKPAPSDLDTVPPIREHRIAALYAQLGEWSRAMDWVLKERERRPRRFRLYLTNPDFAGLKNDPRFLPLVKQEGLEKLAH
ncbi:MAG TPA: protein kinase [Gemmatimonadales bacterium]|jgi:serine/threonine-protein kinase|nr:protein kinase [Gemmatimonadales bacterium]